MRASEHGGASSHPGTRGPTGTAEWSCRQRPLLQRTLAKTSHSSAPVVCSWLDSSEPQGFSFYPWKEVGQIFAKQLTLQFSLTLHCDVFDLEIKQM